MRRLLIVLVLWLAFYPLLSRLSEVQQLAETFRRGNALWLALALLLQLAWLANIAVALRSICRLLGLKASLAQMMPLTITSNFVNTAAPSGGVGGMAVFLADARRRGLSTARVAIAGALFLLFDYFSFLCVLALGMVVIVRRNNLNAPEAIAAGTLLAAAVALAALLVLGASAPLRFEQVLLAITRAVNRLAYPLLRRRWDQIERELVP